MSEIDYQLLALRVIERWALRHMDITIGDVREQMDALGVPDKVRANIMRSAVAKEIVHPIGKMRVRKHNTKSTSVVTVYESLIYGRL